MPPQKDDLAHWWNRSPDGQLVIDEGGHVLAINRTLADWFGHRAETLVDRPASQLFTPTARVIYLGLLDFRLANQGHADEIHLELAMPEAAPLPVMCSARSLAYQGARLTLLALTPIPRKHRLERELLEARRATERALREKDAIIAELETLGTLLEGRRAELARLDRTLDRRATTDLLTGLPNRRRLDDTLELLFAAAERHKVASAFTLVRLHIDHFATLSERHGRAHGDRVLETLADLLRATLRLDDLAARVGDAEFVLLMPHTGPSAARPALERLRRTVEHHPWSPAPVTLSIGLAGYQPDDTAASLYQRAERALDAARHAGRNRVCE
ncbi:sensor domain-containing diguanylate cyclase [Halomonas sp. M4R5S39]|uniref:sensor domain-containing diguanylate cyclase n=1 Tax=Halomonas kalidii TaxID=3043293 RepID=UPI0024A93508|nr:sensor domain-containing diguanylate cyclase [Halomonas kalidii]MDI5985262.1 sensor domain-containing diguanylate cyclase [Halomonas kalidii]